MKRCDNDGCSEPAEHRWCPACWLAYEDFVRDGGTPLPEAERPRVHAKQERGDQ